MRPPLLAPLVLLSCQPVPPSSTDADGPRSAPVEAPPVARASDPDLARAYRAELVRSLALEIGDARVLEAMARVPRHLFVPGVSLARAYEDEPAPIGFDQTISQPTVVAWMSSALELRGRERVLEIGTGSGYQAAVLSVLSADVYTIELVPQLAADADERLRRLGYANVHVRAGDGYAGWPEHAPFDRVIVTAAPERVPAALFEQLADGGVLVAPVGGERREQKLVRYRKRGGHVEAQDLGYVRFVPMVHGDG